jgi:hypothetical protein
MKKKINMSNLDCLAHDQRVAQNYFLDPEPTALVMKHPELYKYAHKKKKKKSAYDARIRTTGATGFALR